MIAGEVVMLCADTATLALMADIAQRWRRFNLMSGKIVKKCLIEKNVL